MWQKVKWVSKENQVSFEVKSSVFWRKVKWASKKSQVGFEVKSNWRTFQFLEPPCCIETKLTIPLTWLPKTSPSSRDSQLAESYSFVKFHNISKEKSSGNVLKSTRLVFYSRFKLEKFNRFKSSYRGVSIQNPDWNSIQYFVEL